MSVNSDDLVDRIYEASVLPELWPDVLDRIAKLGGSDMGGVLFAATPYYSGWTASGALKSLFPDFLQTEAASLNQRPVRLLALNYPGFVSDDMLFTAQEMDQDPFYQYVREVGCGYCFGTAVQIPEGDSLVFSWENSFSRGPFQSKMVRSFDPLRPHLARASLISGRLALQRANAAVEALALLKLPAAVINQSRKPVAANALFEKLIPYQVQDRANGLTLTDPQAAGLFEEALKRMNAPFHLGKGVSSIPIAAAGELPPAIAHAVPFRRGARDLFAASLCILVITPVTRSEAPSAQIIQALFDLTPAEARVAAAIAAGKTQEEIAVAAGLSVNTIKTQLRAVFNKTGVSRQPDLVSLLAGRSLPDSFSGE